MSLSCECCVSSGRGLCVGLRSPTECGVPECDRESSIVRRPWLTGGQEKKKQFRHVNRAVGNLTSCIPVNNYPPFMEPEGLLQCLQ